MALAPASSHEEPCGIGARTSEDPTFSVPSIDGAQRSRASDFDAVRGAAIRTSSRWGARSGRSAIRGRARSSDLARDARAARTVDRRARHYLEPWEPTATAHARSEARPLIVRSQRTPRSRVADAGALARAASVADPRSRCRPKARVAECRRARGRRWREERVMRGRSLHWRLRWARREVDALGDQR